MSQYEFHVSSQSRKKYHFDQALFGLNGTVVAANFAAARKFAAQMSQKQGRIIPASEINAMGLIDEALHMLLRIYEKEHPGLMQEALSRSENPDPTLLHFNDEFPPMRVFLGEATSLQYLSMETQGTPHRVSSFEEVLMLHLANANPAYQPYHELFDDNNLRTKTNYLSLIDGLKQYLKDKPGLRTGETIYDMLTAPARVAPHSLLEQLQYLINRWGTVLGVDFMQKLLRAVDFSKEESIRGDFPGGFAGDAPVLSFSSSDYSEYERFSPDKDWMPRCILVAKNTYVWLEQLSRKYQRWIKTLDQIPDPELDLLAHQGFTGLWLIGLWERSQASRLMKQMLGDKDAVASAYSLNNYDIAEDLGGWAALQDLRSRAWQRGIRLSADMVPNHMGIDSQWVMEHPDWFLSLPYSPFPNYTFEGNDLSSDGRAGIQIEDHYYSRTDAAVVFKRWDRGSGETRFIYHGNDGTSMPWNDTAQLDYSKPEVREAVIQTILHVARNFPVIRFDAAMTLAKKHIQRLWFPEPGAGGAIPSRSEHGLTRAQFDSAVPDEFWRQVVDRVAAEVPDTLLLAEAFWLMEGYFVRTLGMHRVYNSAFMHMLRDEDNGKFRSVIKNTLEFDPQVIKRFVNFMNNPDEKTAIEQFGDGDKYFGVCTMLATLPGLPMFGHGQIEGFHEKYGMEFRKPKWDEKPNEALQLGHEWRIFPLLHKRSIFAQAEHFRLYDFYTQEGFVNEDVFAYSNQDGDDRGLIVFHNKYAESSGWVKGSAAFMDKNTGKLIQQNMADGLNLPDNGYAIFTDYVSHLEYIRSCRELSEKGLFVKLGGYQCHAFLDWQFVSGPGWEQVNAILNGSGVSSVKAKYDELTLKEIPDAKKLKRARKTLGKNQNMDKKPTGKSTLAKQKKAQKKPKPRSTSLNK